VQERQRSRSPGDIAHAVYHLGAFRICIARMIDRLEKAGFVRRGRSVLERALSWLTSGAGEDDESLGRSAHRDVAVDRSFDALAKRLWVDEDDQVELEPLRQHRGQ
jgi:hypothetical protein